MNPPESHVESDLPLLLVEGPEDLKRFSEVASRNVIGHEFLIQIRSADGKENIPRLAREFRSKHPDGRIAAIIDGDQRYLPKQKNFFAKLAMIGVRVEFLEKIDVTRAKTSELLHPFYYAATHLLGEGQPKTYDYLKNHPDLIWCGPFIVTKHLLDSHPNAMMWGFFLDGLQRFDLANMTADYVYQGDKGMPDRDELIAGFGNKVAFVVGNKPAQFCLYLNQTSVFPAEGFDPGLGSFRSLSFTGDGTLLHCETDGGSFDFNTVDHTFAPCAGGHQSATKPIDHMRVGRLLPNDGHRRIADKSERVFLMRDSSEGFVYPFTFVE